MLCSLWLLLLNVADLSVLDLFISQTHYLVELHIFTELLGFFIFKLSGTFLNFLLLSLSPT